jgi:hypothetical protein
MDLVRKKIKGASILESLVAMTIILLSVTLCAGIYSGISGQTKGLKSVLFQNECEKLFESISRQNTDEPASQTTKSNYLFEVQTEKYMGNDTVLQVKIRVKEKSTEKKVFEFNRLLRKPATNN